MIHPIDLRKAGKANTGKHLPQRHRFRTLIIVFGVILLLLIALRLAMEPLLLRFVNQKLDQIPAYKGHIEDVDLSLWRGAYKIQGVQLLKVQGQSRIPFFEAEAVDLSVEWNALLRHHSLVGEIEVDRPRLNFVVGPTKKESQTGIDDSWQDRVTELFPLNINRFAIHDGEIHFRDLTRTPKVDIHLDGIKAEAKGLTNHPRKDEALPATFHAEARAMEHAKLRLDLKSAPLERNPTFDMDGELTGLRLPALNDFLLAYAKVSAEGGTFSLFTEMAAHGGDFKGYVKPLLKDVKIFSPGEKDEGGPISSAWQALVAGVVSVFENKKKEQVATQVPLEGKFSHPSAGVWKSVGYLLRNAFIEALRPSLAHSVGFQDVTGGKKTGITATDAKKAGKKADSEKAD
jgi:hypothetical protein